MKDKKKVKDTSVSQGVNALGWVLAFILVVLAMVLAVRYASVDVFVRAAVGLVWLCALLAALALTSQGRLIYAFFFEARAELRRVTWPGREEASRVTMLVGVVVLIAMVLLWGLDTVLMSAFGLVAT